MILLIFFLLHKLGMEGLTQMFAGLWFEHIPVFLWLAPDKFMYIFLSYLVGLSGWLLISCV